MIPVAIAVAVGTGIAQYMNSEQARKASAKERQKMSEALQKIQEPGFDFSNITPEEYKVIGKYVPQVAQYVAEANPTLIEKSGQMKEGQGAMLDALRQYKNIAQSNSDPAFQAQMDLAARKTQAEAQSRQESALLAAQRRGQGGSLASLGAQLQGGSAAMDRNAEMGKNAAIEAYRNKLDAMRQSAALGGQVYAQDEGYQRNNADIVNSYNARAATGRQNYLNNSADTLNSAQRVNLQAAQGAADSNVAARNSAALANRDRVNALRQQVYGNTMAKYGQQVNNSNANVQGINSAAQDRNQAMQSVAGIAGAYADRQNAKDVAKIKYGKDEDEDGDIFS